MEGLVENNLDKEVGALSGLFGQIIAEMKNGTPNFDEFVSRAGKLHITLKNTILVLGSFLDSFQKIADAASNTKGATRDIGTCLTRIVIRHRALESRMKTLAGALMDCLVLPIQGKLEEWKKSAVTLDKEHSKGYKKSRALIKKKSDQVSRLKKKLKKEKVPDPSVQRLFDQCSKDLKTQFKAFEKSERSAVTKALSEDRNRYCTFVAFLKPVLDEEIAMFTEIHQIEDILSKLNRTACLKESSELFVEDFVKNGESEERSLCYSTPPSTPSSAMGSRKGSMSSLDSGGSGTTSNSSVSISINGSPTRRSIQSGPDYEIYAVSKKESHLSRPSSSLSHRVHCGELGRPLSSTSWDGANAPRPHTISAAFDKRTQRPLVNGSTFGSNRKELEMDKDINSSAVMNQFNNFSTVKRTYSPFHRVSDSHTMMKRPPLPQRCSSAERSGGPPLITGAFARCASIDRAPPSKCSPHRGTNSEAAPHYAIPKPTLSLNMVPNFHSDKRDMVIPHPVYMNCKDLDNIKKVSQSLNLINDGEAVIPGLTEANGKTGMEVSEEDLKTPTVEELSFPGKKATTSTEDASSSSSGSIGSSSGYGSQCTIKFDENGSNCPIEGQSTPQSSSPTHHTTTTQSESYNHPHFLENRQFLSNIMTLKRRSLSLRRNNDSGGQGVAHSPSQPAIGIIRSNSSSNEVRPPPPLRRSSMGSQEDPEPPQCAPVSSFNSECPADEDDTTPRGSVEDIPPMMSTQEPTSLLRRSSSMTSGPTPQMLDRSDRFRRSYQPSSLFSTLSSKLNNRLKIEERPETRRRRVKSPDGGEYGFGLQFVSSRSDYFGHSSSKETPKQLRLNPSS